VWKQEFYFPERFRIEPAVNGTWAEYGNPESADRIPKIQIQEGFVQMILASQLIGERPIKWSAA
jgi:hypothetical protein